MDPRSSVLLFYVDEHQCAIETPYVERVIPAVLITKVPHPAPSICGVVNVHGIVAPVFDMRHHLNLPPQEMELSDKMIILTGEDRKIILWVERIGSIEQLPSLSFKTDGHDACDLAQVIRIHDKVTFLYCWDKLIKGSLHHGDHVATASR